MRLALVIFAMAAIAVGVVHIRRARTMLSHDIQKFKRQQIVLTRELDDQKAQMGWLFAPAAVRRRGDEQGIQSVQGFKAANELAAGDRENDR